MAPSTTASSAALDFFCTNEDLFITLEKISSGYLPLPGNVFRDIDPYQHGPWNLPDDIWYYVEYTGKDSSSGHWKPKGEDCKLYSNPSFNGWRTTFEFYEGEAPHEQKTAWVMQKYWITREAELFENSKNKEAISLCKIFLGDEQFPNHEKNLKMDTSTISNIESVYRNQLVVPDASNNVANGSTSKSHISEDDKMVELAVAGKPSDYHSENLSEMDYLSRGDFMELLDLDIPASPSSSSENSSCLTMSSDDYFDSVALLKELDQDINRDSVHRGAACKYSSASSCRLNKVVVHQEASESVGGSKGDNAQAENLRIVRSMPGPKRTEREEREIKHTSESLKAGNRGKGPSSSSHAKTAVSNDQETATKGGKKVAVGRMKKIQKKYLCFFPF